MLVSTLKYAKKRHLQNCSFLRILNSRCPTPPWSRSLQRLGRWHSRGWTRRSGGVNNHFLWRNIQKASQFYKYKLQNCVAFWKCRCLIKIRPERSRLRRRSRCCIFCHTLPYFCHTFFSSHVTNLQNLTTCRHPLVVRRSTTNEIELPNCDEGCNLISKQIWLSNEICLSWGVVR